MRVASAASRTIRNDKAQARRAGGFLLTKKGLHAVSANSTRPQCAHARDGRGRSIRFAAQAVSRHGPCRLINRDIGEGLERAIGSVRKLHQSALVSSAVRTRARTARSHGSSRTSWAAAEGVGNLIASASRPVTGDGVEGVRYSSFLARATAGTLQNFGLHDPAY